MVLVDGLLARSGVVRVVGAGAATVGQRELLDGQEGRVESRTRSWKVVDLGPAQSLYTLEVLALAVLSE